MSKSSSNKGLRDVVQEFIRDVHDIIYNVDVFSDESVPGYWHAVEAIQNASKELRMIRQKLCGGDNSNKDSRKHASQSVGQLPGCPVVPSSPRPLSPPSIDDPHRHEEFRGKSPLSLATAVLAPHNGYVGSTFSPMSMDSNSSHWADDAGQFLASHVLNIAPLDTRKQHVGGMVNAQSLAIRSNGQPDVAMSPSHYEALPWTSSALHTDSHDVTGRLTGGPLDNEIEELQDFPEDDINGGEAGQFLSLFLTDEALDEQSGQVAEEGPVSTNDGIVTNTEPTALHSDMVTSTEYQDESRSELTLTDVTSAADDAGSEECTEDSVDGNALGGTIAKKGKGRKKGRKARANNRDKGTIPAEIVKMPYYLDSRVEPQTVYSLILFRCADHVTATTLEALTKLFFGIASAESLREFQEMCFSDRPGSRSFSADSDLQQTVNALNEVEVNTSALKCSRRKHLARLVELRNIRAQEFRGMPAKRSRSAKQQSNDHSHASPLVLPAMMAELHPDIATTTEEYVGKYTALNNKLSIGRHWYALQNRIPGGRALLELLPRSGPHAVSDSRIEKVCDSVFETFLEVLFEHRRVYLENVAAKISPILDAINVNEELQPDYGHPSSSALSSSRFGHELPELFICLEDELQSHLVVPEKSKRG